MSQFKKLIEILSKIKVSDANGKPLVVDNAVAKITRIVIAGKSKNKAIFIGNGGSASIASHIATDLLKNGGVAAIAFNDASLLTCLSNDLGYEYVFERPIEVLAKKGDILFAISSSGKSKNILNAALKAKQKGCFVVTLSGFKENNPLRSLGDVNFYVSSESYGHVEIAHLAICHDIVDRICEKRGNG